MDRYSPRLIRGVAAAGVSIFLVAGAAFAANAVMGPRSTSPDLVPAAAGSPFDALNVAEPNGTAEPTETAEPTRTANPTDTLKPADKTETAEPAETAEPTESPEATRTAEPAETPEVEDESGDDHDGDHATSTLGATSEPTWTNAGGGHGGDQGSDDQGGDR